MIPIAEVDSEFNTLKQHYQKLVLELLSTINLKPESITLQTTDNALADGLDGTRIYRVENGLLGQSCHGRKLFSWEEGDLILPDFYTGSGQPPVNFQAEGSVFLSSFEFKTFMQAVFSNPEASKLWTRLLIAQHSLMIRLMASVVEEETHTTPGFEYFAPGDTILKQGEPADFVYSLFEGSAEVLVDNVAVGSIQEGEVIGAMAVLTNSVRTATVRAKTRCSVVKVPREQFASLIKTNPNMIHQLLTDMAKHIVKLNQQVVNLSASPVT